MKIHLQGWTVSRCRKLRRLIQQYLEEKNLQNVSVFFEENGDPHLPRRFQVVDFTPDQITNVEELVNLADGFQGVKAKNYSVNCAFTNKGCRPRYAAVELEV